MSSKRKYTVELKDQQYQYLQRMMKRYNLPDESKALRCLLNYAFAHNELADEIFKEVRCFDCG